MPLATLQDTQSGRLSAKVQGGIALLKARAALTKQSIAHERVFGHLSDDVWLSVNTTAYRRYPLLQRVLPSLPDPQTQIGFIGSAGDLALREAFRFYKVIRSYAAQLNRPVTRERAVLDFGCGWGRTLRFFLRDVPSAQLHGADVMPLAIDLSRRTNSWCRFHHIEPMPPSGLPREHFDIIYLYSVFSHLSEPAHIAWLDEFSHLLRPGGLLFATTWHRNYIERCERARHGDSRGTHAGSLGAFIGTSDWLRKYDSAQFCHSPVGGGSVLAADFYGETCIPEPYVRRQWSKWFEIRDFVEADFNWLHQNLIVAQRR